MSAVISRIVSDDEQQRFVVAERRELRVEPGVSMSPGDACLVQRRARHRATHDVDDDDDDDFLVRYDRVKTLIEQNSFTINLDRRYQFE